MSFWSRSWSHNVGFIFVVVGFLILITQMVHACVALWRGDGFFG